MPEIEHYLIKMIIFMVTMGIAQSAINIPPARGDSALAAGNGVERAAVADVGQAMTTTPAPLV